jgi:hypothetical protein
LTAPLLLGRLLAPLLGWLTTTGCRLRLAPLLRRPSGSGLAPLARGWRLLSAPLLGLDPTGWWLAWQGVEDV